MNLQDVYPDNWKNHMNRISSYEDSAMQILAKANLMPKLTEAQKFVFHSPGAAWEPSKASFEAAISNGWARFDPHCGNVLGQAMTQSGWAERKRLYKQLRSICVQTEVKKEPGWENIPGHMMVA